MSGSAYPPPSEQAPIFNSSLFPAVASTTSAPMGSYLTYPTAQSGLETLSSIQVNGTATFANDATINDIVIGRGDTNNTNMSITLGTDWVRSALPAGTQNIAIGQNAPLFKFNNGSFNVALGAATLYATENGSYGTAIGYHSLESSNAGYNTAIGSYSGMNVAGASNTMLGAYTGFDTLTNYVYSTAIGYTAKATGSNQVVLGTATETVICPNALTVASTINGVKLTNNANPASIFMGTGVTSNNPNNCVIIGNIAGAAITTSQTLQTIVGAGSANAGSGQGCSFFGANSGGNTTATGTNNTFIGKTSGIGNITGTYNTCLGTDSNQGGSALTYATAIGAGSQVTTSNTIQLGRTSDNVNCPNTLSVTGIITATGGVSGNASTATTATNISGGSVVATTGSFSSNMVLTGYPLITSTAASSNFILATNSGNSNSIQLSPQGNTALSIGSGGNSVFSGNLTSNGTLTANVGIVNIGNLSFTGTAPTITTNSTEILTLATPATTGGFINLNCQSVATPQISINPTFVSFGSNTNYNGFNMTGAAVIQAQTAMDLILRTPSASTNSILIAPKQVTAVSVLNDGTTRFAQQTLYTFGTTITATITLITAAPLKNFYIITAAAVATISLPTASATYAGSDITFRRLTNVAVITFNQTGGAAVFAPFNSNTLAVSASLSATQFSTRFTCDGTNWYQLATL